MDTKNKPALTGPWLILSPSGASVGMTDDFDTMMQFFLAGYEVR